MDQLRVFVPAGPAGSAPPRSASTQPALPVSQMKQVLQPGAPQPGTQPGPPPPLQPNLQAMFMQRCVQGPGQVQQVSPMMMPGSVPNCPGSPQPPKPRWMEVVPGRETKTSPAPVRPSPDTIAVKPGSPIAPVRVGPAPDASQASSHNAPADCKMRASAPLLDTLVKPSAPVTPASPPVPGPAKQSEARACEATSPSSGPDAKHSAPATVPAADVACMSWATSTFEREEAQKEAKEKQEAPEAGSLSPDSKPARLLEVPRGRDGKGARQSSDSRSPSGSPSPSCRTVGSDDQSVDEVYSRTPSPSPEPTRQNGKQQLAELLELWKAARHEGGPLSIEECECIENIFYDSMNPDRVKIVEMKRVEQPALLRRFCAEEQDSLDRQARSQKTHKQFMKLHGTRWEYAPLIAENGLDPSCGHLTKGSWLGGLAEKAHSYASKGPGPEVDNEDGHKARLFALFVVACVPDVSDGDDERSFGVWRIMSARRMCPAYHVIYSAPADVGRHKRPLIEPRANKAMLLKQGHDGTGTESAGPSSFRCRSVSPPPRSRTPNPSPEAFQEVTSSWPVSKEGRMLPGAMACTSPALKVHKERPSSTSESPTKPRGQAERQGTAGESPAKARNQTERASNGESPAKSRSHLERPSTNESPSKMRTSDGRPPAPSPGVLKLHEVNAGGSSPARDGRPANPARTSPALKVKQDARPPKGKKEESRDTGKDTGKERKPPVVAASWEVQGDDGWIPFRPGCKFKDEPGTIQHICHGKFWYALTFDEDGLTGTQSNTCTGKVRQLRRVLPASPDERQAADITATSDQSQEKKMQTQPALPAGGWYPSLLNGSTPVKQAPDPVR
ncbi:unnamed protein product [Symbiodinium sp. CCMP2592]|nr:unnamed protein product [Symbiodinium sp. CCMP2592]